MDPVYDPLYEHYYQTLYAKGASPPPVPADLEIATDFIRTTIDDRDTQLASQGLPRLRSDAKYLLLTNFVEMIVRPVLQAQKIPASVLSRAIWDDIHRLMAEAASRAKGQGDVSGHTVIDTLSQSWKQLSVMTLKVWE